MPQLDIYLLNTFVWSILLFFVLLYIINIVFVNLNLFIVLNFRYLKNFIDKIFMFFCIEDYNQKKKNKLGLKFFSLKKKNIKNLKISILKNDFINVSYVIFNLYNFFNLNKEINLFIKLNIENNRIR